MNCLKQQTKKTRSHWFFALGISLMGGTNVSLAQSSDLIAFGIACLVKEERLKETKNRLDGLSLGEQQTQIQFNLLRESIDVYLVEKTTLETSITECADTTPNSAYCHRIRHRYNVLNQLIEEARANTPPQNPLWDDPIADYEVTPGQYNQQYQAFVALCRNSDAHYALIQDPAAYTEVCTTSEAKASLTCSLF